MPILNICLQLLDFWWFILEMGRDSTKEKLLSVAVSVFAEKSFPEATVAEICELAEANISAVNYHFGSKEKLLRQAVRHAFELAEREWPIRGELGADAPVEERLFVYLNAMIRRTFDAGPAGLFERILSREGTREANHQVAFKEVKQLQGDYLSQILRDFLPRASEQVFHHARLNLIALCAFPNLAQPLVQLLFPEAPTEEELCAFIGRQYRFALSGLAELKTNV